MRSFAPRRKYGRVKNFNKGRICVTYCGTLAYVSPLTYIDIDCLVCCPMLGINFCFYKSPEINYINN